MFTFIDKRLRVIECKHFDNLDIIITGDFYQAHPVRDSWILEQKMDALDILGTNFWQNKML